MQTLNNLKPEIYQIKVFTFKYIELVECRLPLNDDGQIGIAGFQDFNPVFKFYLINFGELRVQI